MTTEPIAGERVTNNLRLVRRLGAGGMGTVWIARHLALNTEVVLKFITGDLAKNAEAVARFQTEAAAASEVRGPHVVQVFDYGVAPNGLPYIAMERLEGEDLGARIARVGFLPPGEVAGVVMQVARALSRAHEKRIVHRDIKPENIFLCDTGEDDALVKVLDFGIAKVSSRERLRATATGIMMGSPHWMSPEQMLASKSLDHRTDLWSLAAVAFYALTGALPFDAETVGGLALAICHGETPVPSARNPLLPPAIDAWFAKACAKDPGARHPSARAMAEALVAIVGGVGEAKVRAKVFCDDDETQVIFALPLPISAARRRQAFSPPSSTILAAAAPQMTFATTTKPSTIRASDVATRPRARATVRRAKDRRPVVAGVVAAILAAVCMAGVTRVRSTAPAQSAASPRELTAPHPTPEKPLCEGSSYDDGDGIKRWKKECL